jgi:hypothetical protein
MISIFISKENFNNYAENIRRHRTKFNRPHDEVPGTCTPLVKSVLRKLTLVSSHPSPYTERCRFTVREGSEKRVLNGKFQNKQPVGKPRTRWKDVVRSNTSQILAIGGQSRRGEHKQE